MGRSDPILQPPSICIEQASAQYSIWSHPLMLRPHSPNLPSHFLAGCSGVLLGKDYFAPATTHAACRPALSRLPDFRSSDPLRDGRPRHGAVSVITHFFSRRSGRSFWQVGMGAPHLEAVCQCHGLNPQYSPGGRVIVHDLLVSAFHVLFPQSASLDWHKLKYIKSNI